MFRGLRGSATCSSSKTRIINELIPRITSSGHVFHLQLDWIISRWRFVLPPDEMTPIFRVNFHNYFRNHHLHLESESMTLERSKLIGLIIVCTTYPRDPITERQMMIGVYNHRNENARYLGPITILSFGEPGSLEIQTTNSNNHRNHLPGLGVSLNGGTPKSSILIGISIIFTIHFGGFTTIFGNTHIFQHPISVDAFRSHKDVPTVHPSPGTVKNRH